MFSYARIALRNVFRNKRRTLITGSVLIFGCMALIITRGFMEYMYWGTREGAVRGTGHLQVYNSSFLNKEEMKPLECGIDNYASLQHLLESVPHVRATEARLEFMGLISNGEKSVAFVGEAVQPERQKRMGMLVQVRTGVDLLASTAENPAILGSELAKSLNAQPGGILTIMTMTADGALNGTDVTVAGMYSTGMKEADSRILSVRLETAQRLLATNRVTKFAVALDRTENTLLARTEFEQIFQRNHLNLAVRTWSELSMVYRQVTTIFSAVFAVLGLIIFVLVVLSSSNTMMMAVFERVQEIGTLMALGTSRFRILGLFLLEGLFFGLIGGTVSMALAWSICTMVNRARIQLPPMPMNTEGFPIMIQPLPGAFIGVFFLAVIMMVFGAVLPALRGSRLKIVDALGHI